VLLRKGGPLGEPAARRLAQAIWALDRMEDAADLLTLAS
jgi:hypothetical protein